ncbi:MAG TPA: histidine phosphatase family protein [Mycobacteriales bacterium]|nr:histidine phosphatase family protein [Mycobacteriales bacterium]
MTTVVLLRHGLTAMTGPVLAGWTPGVHLDDRGWAQAEAVAERLKGTTFAAVVSSPLERCVETAFTVTGQAVEVDERLGECRYGEWTGRPLRELAKDPMWKVVQQHPSAAVFPGGEALRDVQHRAVAAVREWNARLGPDATWLACSHGDVIKAVVADALGLHLDAFQRIVVDPCSVTVISYTDTRPFLVRLNEAVGPAVPAPARRGRRRSGDAPVGGGGGT